MLIAYCYNHYSFDTGKTGLIYYDTSFGRVIGWKGIPLKSFKQTGTLSEK